MDGLRECEAPLYSWEEAEHLGGDPTGRATRGRELSAEPRHGLLGTIEAQVIPRLMLAHGPPPPTTPDSAIAEGVAELAALVITQEAAVAWAHVEALRVHGMRRETICLELLAPAARYLGQLWEADLCTFTEVTLGLCRLQSVLNELSAQHQSTQRPRPARRALLVPAPGEQHTFGLSMVAEFFRHAGWDVGGEAPASTGALAALVRAQWFAVVGFSVSCDTRLELLSDAIRAVRSASRNRRLGVMVGGRVCIVRPELASLVGADATALDARQACLQAETLLTLLPRPTEG